MMMKVQFTSQPGAGHAGAGYPAQQHHQVVRHGLFAEIQAMNQVVLKFMNK